MIINSICTTCLQPYKILVQTSDISLMKEISTNEGRSCPCPRLCGGEINLVGEVQVSPEVRLVNTIELTGRELYQAIGGLGLSDEIPKSAEVIEALLKSKSVTSACIEEAFGNFYIHELRLDGGVVIHFSSGAQGARILKVTKEAKRESSNPG